MHFLVLVTAELPEVKENLKVNQQIERQIQVIKEQKTEENHTILQMVEEHLAGLTTEFARAVDKYVAELMYPYFEEIEDPKYLEFLDRTDELVNTYENGRPDCIKSPDGTISPIEISPYWSKFVIKDGKVFQTQAGPLHHMKRTKKAKKMKALPAYPYKKLYKSFTDFTADRGLYEDEQTKRYGYWYNPNTMWDWYTIGGRWPDMFLVKDTCKEFSVGERSWCNSDKEYEAPEGYRWVCSARKKDIEWQVMRDWYNLKDSERYEQLKQMFESGQLENGMEGRIVEDGIIGFSDYLYHKDDDLTSYTNRCSIPVEWKYPVIAHDLLDSNEWVSEYDICIGAEKANWHSQVDAYIDSLSENTVLTSVDCHL